MSDPGTKIVHCDGLFKTEHDLISDNAEFGTYRIRHLTGYQGERDPERMSSPQAAHDHVQCIGQLLAECGDPTPTGPLQEQIDRSGRDRTASAIARKFNPMQIGAKVK